MSNVFITGFKSVGKSSVGRMAADRLGLPFLDLDTLIEDQYAAQQGERLGFRDIFRREGETAFRERERQAAASLAQPPAEEAGRRIVSLGGGALMDDGTYETLRPLGAIVLLTAPFEALLERIRQDGGAPAFVDPERMESDLRTLYERRMPVFRQRADVMVDVGGLDIPQAAERLAATLRRRWDEADSA